MVMASSSSPDLKHLAFVPKCAQGCFQCAEAAVKLANDVVPPAVKPTVERAETRVYVAIAPYVAAVQDSSEKLLYVADAKVDTALATASQVIGQQKAFHAQNLEHYRAAREAYLKKVEELVEFLKDKGLTGSAKFLIEAVGEQVHRAKSIPSFISTEAHAALHKLAETWDKLLHTQEVRNLVEVAKPTVEFALKKYQDLHCAVVADKRYKQAYNVASDLVGKAQETSLYKTTASTLYPWVAPYANPALELVSTSGYFKMLVEHIQPAEQAA